MAEVVGLVASIVQLLELSAKIVSRVYEYTAKANDVPLTFRRLANQLDLLSLPLQQIETQVQSRELGEVASRAIKRVLDDVLADVAFLERLFPPPKASTFDRGLQALKSLAWEDKVQERIKRIQINVQLLGFHQNTMHLTMGLTMSKTMLDKLNHSDLRNTESQQQNKDNEVAVAQMRDLVSSMNNSIHAARRLESATSGVFESSISVWLTKSTNWVNHPTVCFLMTDWDGDAVLDLVAVKKQDTGTGQTEVHIFSGASGYQIPILQRGTPLEKTSANFDFLLADWTGNGRPDLMGIKKNSTDTNSTEVHILDGARNFQTFALRTGTGLHETADNATFLTTDWMGTGRADLVFIKKIETGSNSTEVHILSGEHDFSFFLLQTPTALHETDDTWHFVFTYEFSRTHRPNLAAIKKEGSVIVRICLLSGADDFRSFIFDSGRPGCDSQRSSVLQLLGVRD